MKGEIKKKKCRMCEREDHGIARKVNKGNRMDKKSDELFLAHIVEAISVNSKSLIYFEIDKQSDRHTSIPVSNSCVCVCCIT